MKGLAAMILPQVLHRSRRHVLEIVMNRNSIFYSRQGTSESNTPMNRGWPALAAPRILPSLQDLGSPTPLQQHGGRERDRSRRPLVSTCAGDAGCIRLATIRTRPLAYDSLTESLLTFPNVALLTGQLFSLPTSPISSNGRLLESLWLKVLRARRQYLSTWLPLRTSNILSQGSYGRTHHQPLHSSTNSHEHSRNVPRKISQRTLTSIATQPQSDPISGDSASTTSHWYTVPLPRAFQIPSSMNLRVWTQYRGGSRECR